MALSSGTRLGVYDITAPLGEGGMGQVWRATDSTLGRQVAIKILPDAFATDPERLARFEREAKTLASLNHPHIAAIYGFEKSSGMHALVMELVEGEDLSQRIARGAMPLDEALPIAKQIAEALEAAHEQGIIHRDLKPANIKLRADGTVKVLDFGLAKALDQGSGIGDQGSGGAANSPTITTPAMTLRGVILGTAAYMSPEQAAGKPVGKRSDLWSLGVVLLEMLSGRQVFTGESVSHVIAAVLKSEPDWTALPADTPAPIRRLLRRCLEKDRKRRLDSAAGVRIEIDDALTAQSSVDGGELSAPGSRIPTRSSRPLLAAVAVLVALVAAMAMPTLRYLRQIPPPVPREVRLEITTPTTESPLEFALSPDGRFMAFIASGDGRSRLWLRPLDQTEARPMAGTDGAVYPFWSPDSRSIGFFAAGKLLRIDVAGGAPQVVAPASGTSQGLSGSWSVDGTILFLSVNPGPLMRVAASGGEPVVATELDPPRQTAHRNPHFLPDGRHFLFQARGTPESAGIYLGSLDGGAPARLTAAGSGGAFLPPDRVAFVRQGALVARRLDLAGRVLTGDPVTLADRIGEDEDGGRGGFTVSATGLVAYRVGAGASRQFTWVDRAGTAVGVAGEPDTNYLHVPELSPDGRRLALWRTVQGNTDLWLLDLLRSGMTRLTFDAAAEVEPVWSPDGMRLAFASNRTGRYNLYVKASDGSGAEAQLLDSPNPVIPVDWTRDGRWLLYYEVHPATGRDLWALDMTSPQSPPQLVANTPAAEVLAQVSRDGRWVAYQTNESGRFEVVVQPFPNASGKWQVSTAGGAAPRWRADGKELYFLAPDATMMAVPVTAAGASFSAGTPVALFQTRIVDGGTVATVGPQYDVARDGRLLINQPVAAAAAPITVILNWNPEGKR
ncbi:MAG TPA: protein kinase [Vicinamibacterales bacterium]|nr:protein kinase [Vicinamibacterales bacterium]